MSSIGRAFEILEKFRALRRPLSLRDLVREFDYPTSSLADILKTLSYAGYLNFEPVSKTYFPTTRLGELGDWVMKDVVSQGYPVKTLKNLRRKTRDTVLLGTINELEVLYLIVLEASRPARALSSGRRTHRPLILSGVGSALLSVETDDFVQKIYRRTVARGLFDKHSFALDELMERIAACRRDGYVFVKDVFNPAAAIVAMPLPRSYYGQRVAIGIGGPTGRIEPRIKTITEAMLGEVRALSRAKAAA